MRAMATDKSIRGMEKDGSEHVCDGFVEFFALEKVCYQTWVQLPFYYKVKNQNYV